MNFNPYEAPGEHESFSVAEDVFALPHDIVLRGTMPVGDVLHTQLLLLSRRWGYALVCLAMYVGFVIACGMFSPSESLFSNTFAVLGLIVMPAILPFTLLMVYLRLLGDSKKKIGIFAETETLLTNDGINSRTDPDKTEIPWPAFGSFVASQRVILLFVRGSNNHLIVSRKKLAKPSDWPLLLEFLESRFPRNA